MCKKHLQTTRFKMQLNYLKVKNKHQKLKLKNKWQALLINRKNNKKLHSSRNLSCNSKPKLMRSSKNYKISLPLISSSQHNQTYLWPPFSLKMSKPKKKSCWTRIYKICKNNKLMRILWWKPSNLQIRVNLWQLHKNRWLWKTNNLN